MSKVICDVCGTAYAETVTQCPICGCVRSADAKVVSGASDDSAREHGSYTYVKGGRFSKANVKKRNNANHVEVVAPEGESRQEKRERLRKEQNDKNNKGLVITVIALLLAIVAVVIYIVIRFFAPFSAMQNVDQPNTTPGIEAQDPEPAEIPCTLITLSRDVITLDAEGAAALLEATLTPADTTDKITFTSADETIATVDANGKVTAVAAGETVINVTCGNISAACKVVCAIEEPDATVEPDVTEPDPTEPSVPDVEYSFNTVFPNEMTLKAGTTFGLRLQDPNKKSVEAKFTSGNTSVCTVDADGTVHAVAKGDTTVKAEYNGKVYKCRVIVN